ncbi:type II toxin-antitoxin system death-on-curing family toxin [Sinomonas atrocyanea]
MSTFLELDEALALVARLGFHVRDTGLLGSALARQAITVMGRPAYPALPLQAAALLESTVRNRPLVYGNKRTAWVLVVVFLAMNGAEHDMGADQVFDLVVGVADGTVELEKSAEILAAHLHATAHRNPRVCGANAAAQRRSFERPSVYGGTPA